LAISVSDLTFSELVVSDACLGSSEMARRVQAHDWAATPLGPPATWSRALGSAVAIALRSPSPMAIAWGPELTCIYNDAARRVLGDSRPGALGQPARELLRGAWESVGPQLRAVLDRGESILADDEPLKLSRRGSSEVSYFTYALSPIPDDDGSVGGVLLVSQDVTARVLAEAERRRASHIVAQDQDKANLFGNASHELRTRLGLIIGQLELLLEDRRLAERSRDSVAVAHRSALRMLRLVNSLLDFSRLEVGQDIGGFQRTDVARLTAEIAAMFQSAAHRAGVRLVVDCPPLPELVCADPDAWERIVSNLISNALKFTPRGEVRVSISLEGAQVRLTVEDTGIGIARDELAHVFSRFYRSPDQAARARAGAGIGLALVRELVHLHQGTIEAKSPRRRGTRMTVRIPLDSSRCGEDHSDGNDALERVRRDTPNLVISDVMMRRTDGFGLLRVLRGSSQTSSLPVILLSARAEPESSLRALELGADDYIVKPFGAPELLARVRTTLRNARGRTDAAVTRGRVEERARHEAELRTLLDDLRAAQHRVAVAGDAERRRIERDLHDGAQQRLMALRLELGLLEERLTEEPNRAAETLKRLRLELDEALEELRELAHGLYPPLLASDGLEAALGVMARRSAIPVTIAAGEMTRAPRSIESTVYFCCLEALQNATKHAGPDAQATIELEMSDEILLFSVCDNGVGFDPSAVAPGHGLVNLRDRLQALGGDASVRSSPGDGTTVSGHIPLP
jgi:signal transduction histidine kinase